MIKVDSNNTPHVVWTDGRSGKLDIYYAYGIEISLDSTSSSSVNSSPSFTLSLFCFVLVTYVIIKRKK